MAINNFTRVWIDDGILVADGTSDEASPAPQKIDVVVHSLRNQRRSYASVAKPSLSPWPARTATAEHPFEDGDDVYVVGIATYASDGPDPFLWARKLRVGDPALTE